MYLQTSSGTFAPAENLPNNGNTFAAGTADFDHDGDLDIFTGQSTTNGVGNRFLRNTGGTATIGVANTYPTAGYIPDGTEDDVLRTVFRHNGQSGDVALELAEMRLSLYDANCTTPLNTAQANAIIDTVLVRLDDGDLVFETDGSDVVVASVGMMSLTAVGEQTILFADGDPNVQVSVGGEKRYWVSLVAAVGAGAQNPRTACVRYDADAQTLVEGKTPDFGVSIADTSAVQTNNVPLAVTLSEVGVIGVLHGEFSRVLLATAVLLFVSGGLLFIQWHQRA